MVFIRTKRVKKNGKVYEYQYWQASVRVPRKRHPKSVHIKKSKDYDQYIARGLDRAEREAKEVHEYQRKQFGETAEERLARQARGKAQPRVARYLDSGKMAANARAIAGGKFVGPNGEAPPDDNPDMYAFGKESALSDDGEGKDSE